MEINSNTATSTADGFSVEERAAMKQRIAELRAERTNGAKKARGLSADPRAEAPAPDARATLL